MKKTLSLVLAVLLIFSLLVPAHASDSTYRWQLDSRAAKIYDLLAAYIPYGSAGFTGDFAEPLVFTDADQTNTAFSSAVAAGYDAFLRDFPEVFWLSKDGFGAAPSFYADESGIYITGLTVRLSYNTSDVSAKQSELEAVVSSILSGASGSDYDKIRYFHDAITSRCSYAYDQMSSYGQPLVYESYGALVDGYALCEGYAKAFKLLCNRAGIPCECIIGTESGGSHMWNYVLLDGQYYLMDVTFDDTTSSYAYFLKGSASCGSYVEGSSFVADTYTGLYNPTLSVSDYSGGASASEAPASPTPADPANPADPVPPSASANPDTPAESGSTEPAPEPPRQLQPPQLPDIPEGSCRITADFHRGGKLLIKAMGKSGFVRSGDILPAGTVLQVMALPDSGYVLSSLGTDHTENTVGENGGVFLFSLDENTSLHAVFSPVSSEPVDPAS